MKKQKKQFLPILIVLLGLLLQSYSSKAQNYTCKFVAEISLISVEKGAFLACTKSANPAACSIALAAHSCGETLACDGLVKEITEIGCNYVVKATEDKLKIIGKATEDKIDELKKTWNALNTVEGIKWIENSLLKP